MSKTLERILKHIEERDIDKALDALEQYLDETKSQVRFSRYLDNCEDTIIMLRARHNRAKKELDFGLISEKDLKRNMARINMAILQVIDEAHLIDNMKELEKQVEEAPTLKLEADFDSYTEEDFKALQETLKKVLPEDARVNLLGIKRGSVEVMLEISEADMAKLLIAIKDEKVLAMIGIAKIEFRSMKNVAKPVTRGENIKLLQEKLEKLNRDRIISSDSAEQFELDQQIKETKEHLSKLKK